VADASEPGRGKGQELGGRRRGLGCRRIRERFDQLDAIAERVGCVDPVEPLERLVADDRVAGSGDRVAKRLHLVDDEGRVRLGRRPEVLLDAEMHLELTAFEPAAAANGEVWRLGHVRDAEDALVERDRLGFTAGGHGELHVVETTDRHVSIMPGPTGRR
jgi:hypothetical protein